MSRSLDFAGCSPFLSGPPLVNQCECIHNNKNSNNKGELSSLTTQIVLNSVSKTQGWLLISVISARISGPRASHSLSGQEHHTAHLNEERSLHACNIISMDNTLDPFLSSFIICTCISSPRAYPIALLSLGPLCPLSLAFRLGGAPHISSFKSCNDSKRPHHIIHRSHQTGASQRPSPCDSGCSPRAHFTSACSRVTSTPLLS